MNVQRNKTDTAAAACSSQESSKENKIKVSTSTEEIQTVRARSQVMLAASLHSDFPRLGDFLKEKMLTKTQDITKTTKTGDSDTKKREEEKQAEVSGFCPSLVPNKTSNKPASNDPASSNSKIPIREPRRAISTPDGNVRNARDQFKKSLAKTLSKDFPLLPETVENKLTAKYENVKITSTAESKESKESKK